MRTDTATFRQNAFKALRAQGVNSAKSREIVAILVASFRGAGSPVLEDGTAIKVSFDAVDSQTVCVVTGMRVRLHVDSWTIRHLQPLVNCEPTARQIEIGAELAAMIPDLYAAIGDACLAWDAANPGAPADRWDERSAWAQAQPAVAEVNARYDALKAESLAINANVDVGLVDPDKASHWYEWTHDVYHYRPSGFHTLAMVEDDMARMRTMPMEDEEWAEAA